MAEELNVNEILGERDLGEVLSRTLSRLIALYSDRGHFVHELMQNAEDVEASTMKFELFEDRLEMSHDGKPFTAENLKGICDVGLSDKIENAEQIGQFGIGFKAVFCICDVVRLYSNPSNWRGKKFKNLGKFSIEIQNYITPVNIMPEPVDAPYTTKFVFPFAVGQDYQAFKSCEQLALFLDDRLKKFDSSSLLFMKHLTKVSYVSHLSKRIVSKEFSLARKNITDTCVDLSDDNDKDHIHYLRFTKNITGDIRSVDVAYCYKIDKNGDKEFIAPPDPYLFIYFPSTTLSHLNFIVQGPYHTTPNRSTLPDEDEFNDLLVTHTAELFHSSLLALKSMGLLNLQLLSLMPIAPPSELYDEEKHVYRKKWLYAPVQEAFNDMLIHEKIIPTTKPNLFVDIAHGVIIRNSKLLSVFDEELLSELISISDIHFISAELNDEDNSALYQALRKYGLKIFEISSLAKALKENNDFLPCRDKKWLCDFYMLLADYPGLFRNRDAVGSLVDTKMILTDKGTFTYPRSNCVYIPSELMDDKYDYVDSYLYGKCPDFFKLLNLNSPNVLDFLLDKLQEKYTDGGVIPFNENVEDWKKIIDLVNRYGLDDKQKDRLKRIRIFAIHFPNEGKKHYLASTDVINITRAFHRADEYYLYPIQSKEKVDLDLFYARLSDVALIDLAEYKANGVDIATLNMNYSLIKIRNSILVESGSGWHYNSYLSCNSKTCPIGDFDMDFNLEMATGVISSIRRGGHSESSKYKSKIIMKLLQQHSKHIAGEYYERMTNPVTVSGVCSLLHCLENEDWLYTRDENLVCANQISKRELDESLYGSCIDDVEFYTNLGFKQDVEDSVESFMKDFNKNQDSKEQTEIINRIVKLALGMPIDEVQRKLDMVKDMERLSEGVYSPEQHIFDEFPTRSVRNYEHLRKHVRESYKTAPFVEYEERVIQQRVSALPIENKTYVQEMYEYDNTGFYACQMCENPTKYITATQIDLKPIKELPPMHLCLCPNCYRKYINIRNRDNGRAVEELLRKILKVNVGEDNILMDIDKDTTLNFTAMHVAEIQELLKCSDYSDEVLDDDIVLESGDDYDGEDLDGYDTAECDGYDVEKQMYYKRGEGPFCAIVDTFLSAIHQVPSRCEIFDVGAKNKMDLVFSSYWDFLCQNKYLSAAENEMDNECYPVDVFDFIENMAMNRSYKIPVLLAFIDGDKVKPFITSEDLYRSCREFYGNAERRVDLILPNHISFEDAKEKDFVRWAKRNPIYYLTHHDDGIFTSDVSVGLMAFESNYIPYIGSDLFLKHFKDAVMYRYKRYALEKLKLL